MTQSNPTIQSEDIQEINYRGFVTLKAKLGVDIMAQLTEQKAHMLHMAIGVAGEAAELLASDDRKNTLEECGDLEFFLEGITINNNQFQYSWDSTTPGANNFKSAVIRNPLQLLDTVHKIVIASGEVLDSVKKYTIYNKPLDTDKLYQAWHSIHVYLNDIYDYLRVTRLDVLKMNADKLNKRYKAGYSDKEAQERADKKEGN